MFGVVAFVGWEVDKLEKTALVDLSVDDWDRSNHVAQQERG